MILVATEGYFPCADSGVRRKPFWSLGRPLEYPLEVLFVYLFVFPAGMASGNLLLDQHMLLVLEMGSTLLCWLTWASSLTDLVI